MAPVIEYAVNRDYIAEVLCINKAKPELACDGKCHLKSSLDQEFENDTPANNNTVRIQIENILIYVEELFSFDASDFQFIKHNFMRAFRSNLYRFTAVTDFFHPPR
jgi:hypothetical protein